MNSPLQWFTIQKTVFGDISSPWTISAYTGKWFNLGDDFRYPEISEWAMPDPNYRFPEASAKRLHWLISFESGGFIR
jgi:hypothetical protein